MLNGKHVCSFHGCRQTDDIYPYHIVFDLYARLCPDHGYMAMIATKSQIELLEFLVALKGNSPEYRQKMRKYIINETSKKVGKK